MRRPVVSWQALRLPLLFVGLMAVGAYLWFFTRLGCGDDVQVTPISGSEWVVLNKFYSCSAIDGAVTVTAKNTRTQQEIDIAVIDEPSSPDVRVISAHRIELTFENLTDIVESRRSFGNVSVDFKYKPADNPEARRRYQYWMHHPNDPKAERWLREHFKTDQDGK